MLPTPLNTSQIINGLDLVQMGDVLAAPNNAYTSIGKDAELMEEEKVVVETTEILV